MKVLQLAKKIPWPAKDGESLAIINLTKAFIQQNCQVTFLALSTQKHPGDLNNLPEAIKSHISFGQCYINTNFNITQYFKAAFKNVSYPLFRFYSKEFEALIIKTLQKNRFDIIHLEGLYMLNYIKTIRKYSKAKVVLRAHNVENQVWDKMAINEVYLPKKVVYKLVSRSLKSVEKNLNNLVDAIVTISNEDEDLLKVYGFKKPTVNIPFGINLKEYDCHQFDEKETSIGFIGALDWPPNIEGLQWFIDQVFPSIQTRYPNVKFHVAGRNMPIKYKRLRMTNVIMEGEVEDAKKFIASHPIFIVPLLSGSGMRIKLIEAMALGSTVVSTTIGATGVQVVDNENSMIADADKAFIDKIGFLIEDIELRNKLKQKARTLVNEQYDNEKIGRNMINFYKNLAH